MRTARITARTFVLAGVTVAVMAMAAPARAGGGGHGGPCQAYAPDDATEIVLQDNCFGPVSATASGGSTVTIRNEGQQSHTYTAVDGSFDTGLIEPGGSATIELSAASGTVPVYCTLHADPDGNGMAGTITIAAAPAETGTPDLGSSALGLAGGFVLGSATLAALRRRTERSDADAVAP